MRRRWGKETCRIRILRITDFFSSPLDLFHMVFCLMFNRADRWQRCYILREDISLVKMKEGREEQSDKNKRKEKNKEIMRTGGYEYIGNLTAGHLIV